MSFIIKGIDLPKDGELHLVITKNGIICGAEYPNQIKHAYPLNLEAEAIQIPKDHGKIGDLDIAIKNIEESISYVNKELKEYKAAENKDDYVDNYEIKVINEMAGLLSAQVDVALTPIILEKEEQNGKL